jgi:hypothetical protein
MTGSVYTVQGVDNRKGATKVFVWRRLEVEPKFALLGSGAISKGQANPPQSAVGAFSVPVMLPEGCSHDDIVVTDDISDNDFLPGVSLIPGAEFPSDARVTRASLTPG